MGKNANNVLALPMGLLNLPVYPTPLVRVVADETYKGASPSDTQTQ